jgi:hypothetical protein
VLRGEAGEQLSVFAALCATVSKARTPWPRLHLKSNWFLSSIAAHTCNPSTWEAKARGSSVQGQVQPGLLSERPCLKKKKERKKEKWLAVGNEYILTSFHLNLMFDVRKDSIAMAPKVRKIVPSDSVIVVFIYIKLII